MTPIGRHDPASGPGRKAPGSGTGTRSVNVIAVGAVAATAAFAGGGLLTQTVLVPLWQRTDAAAFLALFRTSGPVTGATLFPIEVISTVLLGVLASWSLRHRLPGRLA